MQPHKKLYAYTLSFEFVTIVYSLTESFPKEERYGLTSQIRRAAVSVPVNIAEGAARRGKKEFIQFLHYSLGSVMELDTLLSLSKELRFVSPEQHHDLLTKLERIGRLLSGLIHSIQTRSSH